MSDTEDLVWFDSNIKYTSMEIDERIQIYEYNLYSKSNSLYSFSHC